MSPTADAGWTSTSYPEHLSTEPALEDVRGVDLGQIRLQRRVPVDERVHTMVEAANVMLAMQHEVRAAHESRR